jgi:hypothetical protein
VAAVLGRHRIEAVVEADGVAEVFVLRLLPERVAGTAADRKGAAHVVPASLERVDGARSVVVVSGSGLSRDLSRLELALDLAGEISGSWLWSLPTVVRPF